MKKIILGSIFAAFILLMLPSIPAVEHNSVLDENELNIFQKIKQIEMDIKDSKEQIINLEHTELNEKINIKTFKEKIEKIDETSLWKKLEYKHQNQPAEPNCIITLLALRIILRLINIILTLGVNILFFILDFTVGIIKLIITVPVAIIQFILLMLINLIDIILAAIFDIFRP